MLKFFRKYRTILLAGAGSLLMLIFLLQPVMQGLTPDPGKRKVALVGAGQAAVTARELAIADFDINVVETIVDTRYRLRGQPGLLVQLGLTEATAREHWYLLIREARAAGLVGINADGRAYADRQASDLARDVLFERAQQVGREPTPDERQKVIDDITGLFEKGITEIASRYRVPPEEVYAAFSRIAGVERLVGLYQRGPRVSDLRLRSTALEQFGAAFVDAVVIGPEAINADIPEPTDEQLAEHLASLGDIEPGNFEANPLGLGYRQPPSVKVGYIFLSPDAIRPELAIDRVEVNKRWRKDNPGADPSEFEARREETERVLRQELAAEIIEIADQSIRGELLAYSRAFTDEGPYKVLPDNWRATFPNLGDVAQRAVEVVKQRTGQTINRPFVNIREEQFLPPDLLRLLPGVAAVSYRVGSVTIPAKDLALALRETQPNTILEAQVGIPLIDPVATDTVGNRLYLTVLAYRPAGPPESIAAIRTALREGWRFTYAYERLSAELDTYARVAREGGLDQVAALFDSPASPRENPVRAAIARDVFVNAELAAITTENGTTLDPRLRESRAFRDAVRAAARTIDPIAPIDSTARDIATIAVPMPEQRCVAVATVRAYRPVTLEILRAEGERVALFEQIRPASEARRDLSGTWAFSYAALVKRNSFRLLASDEDAAEPGSEPPAN